MIEKVFPRPIEAKYINKGVWKLISYFEYDNPPVRIIIPRGFQSDGASIPKIFWSIIGSPWTGKYARAALVHDYLYFSQTYTRQRSDRIFLEAMKVLKVSWLKRRLMYRAVRIAGWIPWNRRKKKLTLIKKRITKIRKKKIRRTR